jgi:hypothetical protein
VVSHPNWHVFVTNHLLGHATEAQVVATTPKDATNGDADVALLSLPPVQNIQPLALTSAVASLDPVIAAGYPAVTVKADEAFDRLLHGDTAAVPEVILTDGKVNAIQPTENGIKILPHTAPISGGNSGGPLVDGCGRVVGINTFINFDKEQVAHVNYAQKIEVAAEFLAQHGVSITPQTDACTPGAPRPPAPPAQQGAQAQPGPNAPPAPPTPAPPGAPPRPAQ